MTNLVTLKTYSNAFQANFDLSILQAHEIDCCLFDENTILLNPLYNITIGGIKLKVRTEDLEHALEILAAHHN